MSTAALEKEGVKFDNGKNQLDLVPVYPLWVLGTIYTFGANKYAADNWRKGISYRRIFAAILRHLYKWWSGEEVDEESNLSHLGHAAWGIFTLIEYTKTHKELDDRPKAATIA